MDMLVLNAVSWWVWFWQQPIDEKNRQNFITILNYQLCQKVFLVITIVASRKFGYMHILMDIRAIQQYYTQDAT